MKLLKDTSKDPFTSGRADASFTHVVVTFGKSYFFSYNYTLEIRETAFSFFFFFFFWLWSYISRAFCRCLAGRCVIVWFTRGRSIIGVSVPTGDVLPLLPHKSASCHGGVAFTVLPEGFAGLVPGAVKDGRQMGCVPSPPPPCLRYKGPFKTAVWAPLRPRPRQSLRKKMPGAEIENRGGAIGKKKQL